MDKVTWTHKPYLFQWGDVIINVWVVSEFSHEYVTLDSGIKFAKVMSVIRKKIAYQRNKDRAFLINLAYRFLGMVGANGKNLSAVFNQDSRIICSPKGLIKLSTEKRRYYNTFENRNILFTKFKKK